MKRYVLSMLILCLILSTFSGSYVLANEIGKDIEISFVNANGILRSNKNEEINISLYNNSSQDKGCKIIISLYNQKDECINSISFNQIIKANDSTECTAYMKIVPEACRIKAYVVDSRYNRERISNEIKLCTSNLGVSTRREKIIKIEDIDDEINREDDYTFPDTVTALTSMGKAIKVPVIWDGEVNTDNAGIFTYKGIVPIINKEVKLTLTINSEVSKGDDEVLTFPDEKLEDAIRKSIDKPYGDIYKNDVKNLKKLVPINYGIYEIKDLTGIEHLESLEVLDIDYMQVSDLSPARDLRNLKWLYAAYNPITTLEAGTFRNMRSLEQLGLEGCSIETIEKGAFDGLTKLHYLDVTYNYLDDVEEISNISTLTSLHLDYNSVTNLKPLSKLTNLELLWVDGNGIQDVSPLAKLVNLKRLKLGSNSIKTLTPLRNLIGLEELDVRKNYLTSLDGIENMASLVKLCANENTLTDVKALRNLSNLDDLEIKNTGTLRDISSFSGLTNLTHLDITGNRISNISSLSNLINLEYLWMEGNQVSDIKPLANLVNLKLLTLNGNNITDFSPVKGYYHKLKTKDFTLN